MVLKYDKGCANKEANMAGVTSGAGSAYPTRAHEFTLDF
jgi:hypothetical protein